MFDSMQDRWLDSCAIIEEVVHRSYARQSLGNVGRPSRL
ncbi:hypothetical protein SAMN06265222_107214 [Neorhodopirellula lusitana]|uniref:Uncharacterized protein n=1 Tax=Neorhodopirellula lusitana TaxID=445327 RepID=A0ABY1QBH5_9BACT|nr:hypothetical protein SAMN06265222_107214 [Neorhodopirellula lusitana]